MGHKREYNRARQRGWAGLIGLVLALVIVAMLAKTVLEQYGLAGSTRKPATAGDRTGLGPVPHETTAVVPAPRDAMERARGLESSVQQQAVDNARRIDDALKSVK
jgi:hypothetical protein